MHSAQERKSSLNHYPHNLFLLLDFHIDKADVADGTRAGGAGEGTLSMGHLCTIHSTPDKRSGLALFRLQKAHHPAGDGGAGDCSEEGPGDGAGLGRAGASVDNTSSRAKNN